MTSPFRAPDTPSETRDQLARLSAGLRLAGEIAPLPGSATATDVANKVNEIIWKLALITRSAQTRRIATTITP